MLSVCRVSVLAIALLTGFSKLTLGAPQATGASTLVIAVDARMPWKSRIPVRLTLNATSGPLVLAFPHWLPGMHAPQGPLGNFGRISITADGVPLAWDRDPFDAYLIHLSVPAGTRSVEVSYEYIATNRSDEVFYGVAAGQDLAVLNPAAFALAPVGDPRAQIVRLRVSLPKAWAASSAMMIEPTTTGDPSTINFAPVSLYTLIDSPILAGKFHRSISLAVPTGDTPHSLDLYADTDEILKQKTNVVAPLVTRLVAESGRMFGVRHYKSFHFMVGLSTEIGRNGLEHHEGVAYILQPDDLDDTQKQLPGSSWNTMLIPHEFTHSWNGKYRRPYGEDTHSSVQQQSADLIWVYEGLTQYLGDVLMVRSGFRSAAAWRNDLLQRAATMRFGVGRDWESVADTALVAPYTYLQGNGTALRSVDDVYYEGELAWLEADAIIRRQTQGKRSLDDFCRSFFGGPNKGPEVIGYTRKDVIDALNKTCIYDWSGFIQNRFYSPPKSLPTSGLEAAGWSFSLTDKQTTPTPGLPDYRYSFGAWITSTARVVDVVPGSLADRAGLERNMTVLGINGELFSADRFRDAVRATSARKSPFELLISEGFKYKSIRIDGMNGERFPTLTRNPSRPDLFAAITAPTIVAPKR